MKINSSTLSNGRSNDPPRQSSYNPAGATPPGASFLPNDVSDPIGIYLPCVQEAFSKYEITACTSMRQAMHLRTIDKMPALTYREMDVTLRRHEKALNSDFFWSAMFLFAAHIDEGNCNVAANPYEIRARYNRGLLFMQTQYATVDVEKQKRAKELMLELERDLTTLELPLWPHEKEQGFATELTKPEWLTFTQYSDACKRLASRKTAVDYRKEIDMWFSGHLEELNKKLQLEKTS